MASSEFEKMVSPEKSGDTKNKDKDAVIDPMTGLPPVIDTSKQDANLLALDKQMRGDFEDPRSKSSIKTHNHDGANSEKIDIRNVRGLIEVLEAVPTSKPSTFSDQIKIVVTGGNTYLYIFDPVANDWLGVQLTT